MRLGKSLALVRKLVRSGMSRRQAKFFAVCVASWVCACGSDDAPSSKHADAGSQADAAQDAGRAEDSGHARDAASTPDAPTQPSAGNNNDAFVPPSNSSFESARTLAKDEDTMQRVVNDRQVDYYSFEARAGKFYELSTNKGRYSPNNWLTVFDAERAMIAENNDGSLYPNSTVDARVIIRAERSGSYFVAVEDRSSMGAEPDGRFVPPLFYSLSLREITAETEGFALELDDTSPTSLRMKQDDLAHARYVTLLGNLSDDDRSDTYELHGLTDFALIGKLLAAGKEGDSSTASTVDVRVIADSDGHLLASCGLTSGQKNIHPPLDDASYRVEISAGDQIGSNGFYAVDLVLLPDNPHERMDADNNNIDAAEPLMLNGTGSLRGLLLSRLPADDVDYYRFEAQADEFATLNCEGESGGSGVRGLQAELLGPDMQSVVEAREASTEQLSVKPFKLEKSGTYYLKLTSETPAVEGSDSEAGEPWVRCGVLIGH